MEHAVAVSNLEFCYPHGSPVLKIEKMTVAAGERVFIFGPSGHGKSTLLNIIAGVLEVKKGSVKVLDCELGHMAQSRRDRFRGENIGYIFQSFNLIPYLNIHDNIVLPCRINHGRARGIDFEQQAAELTEALGLTPFKHKKVTDLSIGQQQRVAAARALIGHPRLLIADEPTSSLDEANAHEFLSLLTRECEKRQFTLIFVSHNHTLKGYFQRSLSLPEINGADGSKP